ncbi:MAG: LysR family transcriptional regulator [Eubacterium sp.]|nr:LysR family transcriptional regulator [Eubacterium sp.]
MNPALAPVSFQQIYVFLAAVEEGGFAKAGLRLHLTQSTISKNISKLEQALDFPLFYRTTREIRLTPAGRELFERWSTLILDLESGYRTALELQTQEISVLNLGVVNTVAPTVYLRDTMNRFHQQYPDKTISLGTGHIWELEQKLVEGSFDVLFLPDFEHYWADLKGYSWQYIVKSNATVLISAEHPLASRESLTLADILDCDFTAFRNRNDDFCSMDMEARFAPYGKKPHIVHYYDSAHDMKYQFHKDKSFLVFLDSYFDYPDIPDVRRIPVTDQQNGMICVWNPKRTKTLIKKFLRHCVPELDG